MSTSDADRPADLADILHDPQAEADREQARRRRAEADDLAGRLEVLEGTWDDWPEPARNTNLHEFLAALAARIARWGAAVRDCGDETVQFLAGNAPILKGLLPEERARARLAYYFAVRAAGPLPDASAEHIESLLQQVVSEKEDGANELLPTLYRPDSWLNLVHLAVCQAVERAVARVASGPPADEPAAVEAEAALTPSGKGQRGAPLKYPNAVDMAIGLLADPNLKDVAIYRKCRDRWGGTEPIPRNASSFLRTARRHAATRKARGQK